MLKKHKNIRVINIINKRFVLVFDSGDIYETNSNFSSKVIQK